MKQKLKIGIMSVCLNEHYWPFINDLEFGLRTFFLKDHDVDILLWTDMSYTSINATIFKTEPLEWPMPTLMRYHLYLQQEEKLKEYDYLFHIDADMQIVDFIKAEDIFNEKGLTLALHPMYALRDGLFPPWEPNPISEAYIRLPGRYVDDGKGGKKFKIEYYAGGFQGGKTDIWISAMKEMRKMIDKDFVHNYFPRWNDESVINGFIFRHPEIDLKVLDPSYIYPDSLISNYYFKVWGRNYSPKIVTITKKFSLSKEAGQIINKQLANM